MLDLRIAILSSTAGQNSDGIVRGSINDSLVISAQSNLIIATTMNVIRQDTIAGGFNFLDLSAEAASEVDDSFEPFGSTVSFSANDAFFLSDDIEIQELFFQITTSGDWVGDGLEVFDSTDGVTANRLLGNIQDDSDGFRNTTGIYRLTWDAPASDRVAFSPVPGQIAEREWIVIKPKNLTGATTAPKLRRMWIKNTPALALHTDFTSDVNTDVNDASFGVLETVTAFFTEGEILYLGLPFLSIGVDVYIHRHMVPTITPAWEYLATDSTWKPLSNLSDESDNLQNGPVNLGDGVEKFVIRWSIPSDWGSEPLTLTPQPALAAHWVRRRMVAVVPMGPSLLPLTRVRAKSYGVDNATGLFYKDSVDLSVVTFLAGIPPLIDTVIQLANINTGQASTYTHPAGETFSGNLVDQHIELSPPLHFNAGDGLLITHLSGGIIEDLEMHIS